MTLRGGTLHQATRLPKSTVGRLMKSMCAIGYAANDRRQGGYDRAEILRHVPLVRALADNITASVSSLLQPEAHAG
jgi:hypothetical protein